LTDQFSPKARHFTELVQKWGEGNMRSFAWRRTTDPYRILVAEILVQRTRAVQAERAYLDVVGTWPDIAELSRATCAEIRSKIHSLGLNYRVKRLQRISKAIFRQFGLRIPDNLPEFKRLYGIGFGDYIAHAILCFAFGRKVPIVDKNVERILTRFFSLKTRADGHRDQKLWRFAAELLPKNKIKEYNWSLIDFGALVCTPKNPKCLTCPLMKMCSHAKKTLAAKSDL